MIQQFHWVIQFANIYHAMKSSNYQNILYKGLREQKRNKQYCGFIYFSWTSRQFINNQGSLCEEIFGIVDNKLLNFDSLIANLSLTLKIFSHKLLAIIFGIRNLFFTKTNIPKT